MKKEREARAFARTSALLHESGRRNRPRFRALTGYPNGAISEYDLPETIVPFYTRSQDSWL
jgi:hypothetical protein